MVGGQTKLKQWWRTLIALKVRLLCVGLGGRLLIDRPCVLESVRAVYSTMPFCPGFRDVYDSQCQLVPGCGLRLSEGNFFVILIHSEFLTNLKHNF